MIKKKKACIFFYSSQNNTIITLTNLRKQTLSWASTGSVGFKGFRRSTKFAARKAVEQIIEVANAYQIDVLDIYINGTGKGRYAALKGLKQSKMKILTIFDCTPLAYNGCRPPKKRRL